MSAIPDVPPTTNPPVPHETRTVQTQEDDQPTHTPMIVKTTLTNLTMTAKPNAAAYNRRPAIDGILNFTPKTHK